QAELFGGQRLLPFQFAWVGERMVVLANQSDDTRLGRGAEIVSVDGRSARRILRALMPYARADGSNDAKRRALLEVRGFDRYETFDVFYGLIYRPGATVRLQVRPPGSDRVERVTVATIDLETRRALLVGATQGDGPVWTLTYPRAQTALLTMPN